MSGALGCFWDMMKIIQVFLLISIISGDSNLESKIATGNEKELKEFYDEAKK